MTVDLAYLAATALLTGLLWMPYVIAQAVANGPPTAANYRDPTPRELPLWGKRAYRMHLNAVEAFAPFAVLVIIAHLTGRASGTTAIWAALFFWMRVAHAVVYLVGVPYLRTLVFTVGAVCTLGVFIQLLG